MQTKTNNPSTWALVALLAGACAPAAAQDRICDDLWFTRNLVFDRAGYCFGSALGQAVFGNEGCTTKAPELTSADKDLVSRVKSYEAEWACSVDTSRTRLNVEMVSLRKALGDLPVVTGYESACIGWQGGARPLFLAKSDSAQRIGTLQPGQTILTFFENTDGWEFVTITDGSGGTVAMGWMPLEYTDWDCEMFAG